MQLAVFQMGVQIMKEKLQKDPCVPWEAGATQSCQPPRAARVLPGEPRGLRCSPGAFLAGPCPVFFPLQQQFSS